MDAFHFLNDKGKYTAKRLPAPSESSVKFKDITDLSGLRYALQDEKPETDAQFEEVYLSEFNHMYDHEVEVEDFETVVTKNRKKFLEKNTWVKVHFDELLDTFDLDELPDEYDWIEISPEFQKRLTASNLITVKNDLTDNDWKEHLHSKKVPELKELAKPIGIKVSQNKSGLIADLLAYHKDRGLDLETPVIIKFKPQMLELLQDLQAKYIYDIKNSLDNFEYPKSYKAAVWQCVVDENDMWPTVHELATEELNDYHSFTTIQTNTIATPSIPTPDIEPSFKVQVVEDQEYKLPKSQRIAFDYRDSGGELSNREIRLDRVVVNEHAILVGFCMLRTSTRHFRLDRVQGDVVFTETGEVIPHRDLLKYLDIPAVASPFDNQKSKAKFSLSDLDKFNEQKSKELKQLKATKQYTPAEKVALKLVKPVWTAVGILVALLLLVKCSS